MKRNITSLFFFSIFFIPFLYAEPEPLDKPNIIFILVDDLGLMDLGYMGNKTYETPSIDKLSRSGSIFTNAYSSSCCAPTRACLMTGLYESRHGIFTVGVSNKGPLEYRKLQTPVNKMTLAPEFTTLPEVLKRAGYVTAHIGKWHIGSEGTLPTDHGFDINVGGWEKGSPSNYFSPYKNPFLPDGPKDENLTDRLTNEAITFIKEQENKPRPFFLNLSYYAVHAPYMTRQDLLEIGRASSR